MLEFEDQGLVRMTPPRHSRRLVLSAPFFAMPAVFAGLPSLAAAAEGGFDYFLSTVGREAAAQGVRSSTVDLALRYAQYLPHVIELDRHQPEQLLTFTQYLQKTVSPQRSRKRTPRALRQLGAARRGSSALCGRSAFYRRAVGDGERFRQDHRQLPGGGLARHARLRRAARPLFSRRADLGASHHRPGEYRARQYERLVGRGDGSMPVHAVDLFALCGRL